MFDDPQIRDRSPSPKVIREILRIEHAPNGAIVPISPEAMAEMMAAQAVRQGRRHARAIRAGQGPDPEPQVETGAPLVRGGQGRDERDVSDAAIGLLVLAGLAAACAAVVFLSGGAL